MLSCKEVSELVSKSRERNLSWQQRFNLWMHLSMCRLCSGFSKDLDELDAAVHRHASAATKGEADEDVRLPEEARERIKESLRSK